MHVGILGAGVAGLSAAIALRQKGHFVTVYERHPQVSSMGAGIVCWPNASFVLQHLGVFDDIARCSGQVNQMLRFSAQDESLGALDIQQLNRSMGYPSFSVLRQDLIRILFQKALSLKIRIHFDCQLSACQTDEGRVSAVFDNGLSISPDLLIGADGRMNSIAREFVCGNRDAVYSGFVNWIGVYQSKTAEFADFNIRDYWGVGERFGIVPVSEFKAYWAGGAVLSLPDQAGRLWPELCQKQYCEELRERFTHWPEKVSSIVRSCADSHIQKIYVHDLNPLSCWHRDNLVLIGDSAHAALPTSGQGACQALEDAWHLADCLDGLDLTQSLQTFTARRLSKTQGIHAAGRQIAKSIFNTDAAYCEQRNIVSQQTDYQALAAGMAKGWSAGMDLLRP